MHWENSWNTGRGWDRTLRRQGSLLSLSGNEKNWKENRWDQLKYHSYSKYLDRQVGANSVDPDQVLQNAASDQGLHCLQLIQEWTLTRLIRADEPQHTGQGIAFPTRLHVGPAKTWINLHICSVLRVFAVLSLGRLGSKFLQVDSGLIRLCKCAGWSESSLGMCYLVGHNVPRLLCFHEEKKSQYCLVGKKGNVIFAIRSCGISLAVEKVK